MPFVRQALRKVKRRSSNRGVAKAAPLYSCHMANFLLYKPKLEELEGGWVDDAVDAGGATMKGVTLEKYGEYLISKGQDKPSKEDLKNIPDGHWNDIMKGMFWDKWKADNINDQRTAEYVVDWTVNSGAWGIKIPQRVMGLQDDGSVGRDTLTAINSKDWFNALKEARISFYKGIVDRKPDQEKFLKGWLKRANSWG